MPTPKVERLVNLTVALLETRRPLTFAEIRDRTREYAQDDAESARRMFERDKDDLRRLGVPVETRERDALSGEVGYTVDRRDYELPDVDLTSEEVTALAVALQLGGGDELRLGLRKLAARAPDPLDAHAPPPARVSLESAPVDAVADAVVARHPVRFEYRAASGDATSRAVDPYAVAQRRGAWYLVGRDHDRDAVRAFRLDRVTSRIERLGEPGAFEIPEDLDVGAAVAGPVAASIDLEVAVAPGARWEAELRGGTATGEERSGWPVYRVPGLTDWRAVGWALQLGPELEVLEPPDVRAAVVEALTHARAVAGDGG